MTARSPRELADEVRAYLISGGWTTSWVVDEAEPERGSQPTVHQVSNVPALAALDALVAQAETAQAERDRLRKALRAYLALVEDLRDDHGDGVVALFRALGEVQP